MNNVKQPKKSLQSIKVDDTSDSEEEKKMAGLTEQDLIKKDGGF
jgi:hypothetical protein